jgi:hypothetical protein
MKLHYKGRRKSRSGWNPNQLSHPLKEVYRPWVVARLDHQGCCRLSSWPLDGAQLEVHAHAVYLKWVVCLSFSPYFSANLEEEKEKKCKFKF